MENKINNFENIIPLKSNKKIVFIRHIDQLGRVLIPSKIKYKLGFDWMDRIKFEIGVNNDQIIFTEFKPYCIFCGSHVNVIKFKNKIVCKECLNNIKSFDIKKINR
jgi:transcriptional pleiotropic regulator of transition state genes